MLTLYQRLLLGCLLLVALVTGVSLLVRDSFVELAALDADVHTADRALAAFASVRAALAREELAAARAENDPSSQRIQDLLNQVDNTERVFAAAAPTVTAFDPHVPIDHLSAEHTALARRDREGIRHIAPELERLSGDVYTAFDAMRAHHDSFVGGLEHRQTMLRARLISACGASIATSLVITVVMVALIITPIRKTAKAARRIGQGDLQHRIEWRQKDDLGIIATELNKFAVRLRDLRETESGRLQMEHQLSDAVVQSIFEPVIVTDAKGHVLKLNQASMELLEGAPSDRMLLTNTPGGEKILAAVRRAVTMQRASTTEGEAAVLPLRIGRAQRSYRLRTTPMRDSDGRLLGAVTVLEDITEMQEVDRFKTRFLNVASQKLRDPLHRLRMSLYALAQGYAGELRPLQRDLVTSAQDESEQLEDLMADLIEVGELETGRRQMKLDRLRPIDILQESAARHRAEALQKRIEIDVQAFADLAYVEGDRRAMRSILDNLVSNALRYTPEGGTILLSATEIKDGVQFFVRDNGRGIETERLPAIFGRFTQDSAGTGLGLALVRRLVESMSGQVSVESKLGHGTTFSFTLPTANLLNSRHPVEVG
ncbi:ATP-binding protein [Silvibacterium sp.]|uniref:sensor histidine kinase n=1 Tax=Silvibacterium sp. TaxID=1964179 RepID=UPI0039E72AD2